jgi:hypothetical protein
LFRRIPAGDKDAFSIIFHAYFDPLYRKMFKGTNVKGAYDGTLIALKKVLRKTGRE